MTTLGEFMTAIAQYESGGDPNATGPITKYGRARGRYQIMDANWDSWAADAGVPGADWRDTRAQDTVAAHKMGQYFDKYGSWALVAAAWLGGPGTADRLAANGEDSGALARADTNGTTVGQYINEINAILEAGVQATPLGKTGPAGAPGGTNNPSTQPSTYNTTPTKGTSPGDNITDPKAFIANIFSQVSNLVAGGQRSGIPDLDMTGSLLTQDVPGLSPEEIQARNTSNQALGFEGDQAFTTGVRKPQDVPPMAGVDEQGNVEWGERDDKYYSLSNRERLADPAYQLRAQEVSQFATVIQATFPGLSIGQHRELDGNADYSGSASINSSGGSTRSDHYWGGALDISGPSGTLDRVAAWLQGMSAQWGVAGILWQVANHYDHVHVSFLPPVAGGGQYSGLQAGAAPQGGGVQQTSYSAPPNEQWSPESNRSYNTDPDISESNEPANRLPPSTRGNTFRNERPT